jgi:hypothetical protein
MNQPARLLVASLFILHAGGAAAEDTAESARQRAEAALKAGRIHDACVAFEASVKLAASVDTELQLAGCYEQDGKPMAAARLYRSVVERDTNAARRQRSIARAAKLEANAPKLRFAINPQPPGLVIKVDGVEVPATGDVLVDQGPHEVVATAPGFIGRASAPVDRDRVIVDVIIRMEPVAEPAPIVAPVPSPQAAASARDTAAQPEPVQPAPASSPTSHRRRNGLILGGGGLAVLAGAAVLFSLSVDRFDEEHALCPMSRCANEADLARALDLLSEGRTLRGTSIGMGIGGGVLLLAGGYLLLTPQRAATRVSVQVQPGGAGIGYTASF